MIIYGRDDEVARWYADRLGTTFVPQHMAIGLVDREGYMVGAVLKTIENKYTSSATIYSEAYSLAPFAKGIFAWLFDGAHRITIRSDKKQKLLSRHYQRLGFKFECVCRDYYGPGLDAVQHVMTQDKCRWLNGQRRSTNLQLEKGWQPAETRERSGFSEKPNGESSGRIRASV